MNDQRRPCLGLEALSLWWQIQLDLDNRQPRRAVLAAANTAIAGGRALGPAEPKRAEAWFYLGAAYGARAQFRVYRVERLAAARDGKRIKEALEKALALDPSMHDAEFGIGMYRYYAGVAPAYLRFLRFLLLLPGGDREGGLAATRDARPATGMLVRGEAQYQIQVLYLWYEHKSKEALAIIRGLQERYPHNPLFHQIEAEILDVYFHDHAASLKASEQLLALAASRAVFRADIAEVARAATSRAIDRAAAARARDRQHRCVDRAAARARQRGASNARANSTHDRARTTESHATCRHVLMKVWWMRSIGCVCWTYNKRFVLDNRFFSSIIYIWYEGGRLRPLVVER